MTDNEIIRALECWSTPHGCTGCPFIEQGCFDCGNIPMDISKNILDLINRQKAEIGKLTGEKIFYMDKYHEFAKTAECIKSEAIKEFADKLCDKIVSYSLHVDCEGVETLNRLYGMIDSLVKEMTEVEK